MTISAELMARLLAAAVQFSGLPAINVADLPPVETITAAALSAKMCPDRPGGCSSVAALFDTETYRIYLRDTLDLATPMDNSFLVHELTHVLQFKQFGDAYFSSCRKIIESEREAYRAQNNYLGSEGVDWREGFLLRFMQCPPEDGATAEADPLGRDK
ncbi:MAG: DUF6647 family protein [Burkholderiaceae bacterium]|jgi:hypothetical protein